MTTRPPRPGFHTVTPYLIVRELAPMIDFLHQAFGASEHFRTKGADGGWHVELRVGDSMVMVGGGEANVTEPMPIMLFLYLDDVDAIYQAALAAGATSLMPPTDGAFGEPRGAGVKDIAGNQWYFANWLERPAAPPAYVEAPSAAPLPDVIPMISYENGAAAIDWLAAAFGFVETERWVNAEGVLEHGEMLTGNGRIMLATPTPAYESPKRHREHCAAASAWSETPWVIDGALVYVDDVDAHFVRAKAAGAVILGELVQNGVNSSVIS